MLPITDALSFQYRNRYATQTTPPNQAIAVANAAAKIQENISRFAGVETETGLPWQMVGTLALRELAPPFNFHQHLANGDPLTAKTVHVPAGLPHQGEPPYTFEQGAIAAINHQAERLGIHLPEIEWTVDNALCFLEAYNGLGYRKRFGTESSEFGSPYLWNFTQYYRSGYYTADGKWDENAVCKSIGCAPVLKRLGFRC